MIFDMSHNFLEMVLLKVASQTPKERLTGKTMKFDKIFTLINSQVAAKNYQILTEKKIKYLLLTKLHLLIFVAAGYILIFNQESLFNQIQYFSAEIYRFLSQGDWGNTLFSAINFSLVFFAWFRVGKNSGKIKFNYMNFFLKPGEDNIFRLWMVGQFHATFIFGFLLDNIRTLIGVR